MTGSKQALGYNGEVVQRPDRMPDCGNVLNYAELAATNIIKRNLFGDHGCGLVRPVGIAKAKAARTE